MERIVAGFNGAGGEIGHITVNHDEIEACNCGQYGCLEQYTSATGIVRVAKRKLAKTNDETSLRNFPELTAKDVFDEAKSGDAVALGLVDEVCGILGSTLSNIACVVEPGSCCHRWRRFQSRKYPDREHPEAFCGDILPCLPQHKVCACRTWK